MNQKTIYHRMPGHLIAFLLAGTILNCAACLAQENSPAQVRKIAARREIFVDYYLIDKMENTGLKLHHPQPAGVAIKFDKPWEGIYSGYTTVIKDGDTYRLYYRGNPGVEEDGSEVEVTCCAESKDGINWTRPNLGIYEVMGTRNNNIVLAHMAPLSHNFSPFLDKRPGVSADERYKAISGTAGTGLVGFVSSDGLHWKKVREQAVFKQSGWVFDSQNLAFWSQAESCYVLYYRIVPGGIRSIARTTSTDFIHWTEPTPMTYDGNPPTKQDQLYTSQTAPYFRAPHIYVSLAARFMAGRKVLTPRQVEQISVMEKSWLGDDCSEGVLMTSRAGTVQYDRTFMEGFIRPGTDMRNWGSRGNYPTLGIVQTGPNEMSMYVRQHNGQPTHYVERLTMRLDGFISVNAPYKGGEMVTKPLTFTGDKLEINYATGASGSVRVEIQDESGQAIAGYTLKDCKEIIGDQIERLVTWKNDSDLGKLAGKSVRLRFVMKDADLYSLRFK